MRNEIIHNVDTWWASTNEEFRAWFNGTWDGNRYGDFDIPRSFRNRFTDDAALDKIAKSIANQYIALAVKLKPILKKIPFEMLNEKDRNAFRHFVAGEVQVAIFNQNIIERQTGSTISSGTWTINRDTNAWVFAVDRLSNDGTINLQNTEIDFYEIVEESAMYRLTSKGNIQIIGKYDTDFQDIPDIIF